jgi:hypothetical protein
MDEDRIDIDRLRDTAEVNGKRQARDGWVER